MDHDDPVEPVETEPLEPVGYDKVPSMKSFWPERRFCVSAPGCAYYYLLLKRAAPPTITAAAPIAA